jgi:type II secretory pathway predicted ATPase ExeA
METTFTEHSHPEFQAEQKEALEMQLLTLAREIEGYRQARRPVPSDRSWAKEWPGLGSAKTWSKALAGDFGEMSVAAQLPNYRGVLAALASQRKSYAEEALYPDLGGAQDVALAALRLMHHHGKDRLILIEGGSGSGKTSALDLLQGAEGSGVMYRMEADESWKSPRVVLEVILKTLGVSELKIPASTGGRMELVIAVLNQKGRIFLVVDEAHHVTGAILNLFKSILNRTPALMMLAGMKTLLQKLRTAASEEAKQLFQNRLFCRISLGPPDAVGAREFLNRRLGTSGKWKLSTLDHLVAVATHSGNWSFLRRTYDHLTTAGNLDPNDADLLSAASSAAAEIA